jgi:hypothetical protein
MKYGINLLLWTDTLSDVHFPVLDKIKKSAMMVSWW